MFVKTKKFKKIEKNFKKGVDNLKGLCYYVQARSRAQHLREQPNLENDTETRNANDSQ